ncbi:MAG: type I methionyl aminopeptidase [Christensenellaceae bacterium]|jgi:methionyl aminopeptidase|nr:type I methionyl aminopeptidase [Christensenellaceae bacterium]
MLSVKSDHELAVMRRSGAILRDLLVYLEELVCDGVTTEYVDRKALEFILKNGAIPSFKDYNEYPANICISLDDEIVHGIPGKRYIKDGMLVKVDAGVFFEGFHTDAARTFEIGQVSEIKHNLAKVCKEAFFLGIAQLKDGARLGDYAQAVQSYTELNGFSVVRDLTGHGIGRELHEDPMVLNYGKSGRGTRVSKGMTLALEPMINAGKYHVTDPDESDGWTIRTLDKSPSAHYENTVIINESGVEIITL